ncbi:MerR family transcriptional regulator [Pseudonocardia sp. EC080610-09]|uniref:MerR family transcriptional regulator n=1 Tax=unclassified Pseudonocardia TaxID=2619320 RepID=UPI0006CB06C9|nr:MULTISPECIES: MerR family transcriptional regulator [unclassified Pseudonocardia]ALE74324.1 MerR family transcriptional regulator [Pseudonocardia sp. EC080625-04]ALL77728.1 MerR family transcriptional regulator [Pseudonocardia sp. EC080610-09]ALL80644.1 MerR family transcriptional regulator [Pseudonocardia sp. EC080619-01]
MAWSTREIAELAGTSLRAVRHYHDIGLLEEPERRSNGYKQYGVRHLVRVLHIKRLTDLGFSLSQIAAMGDADDHPEEALRTLDAELAATIERLQRVRVELGLILQRSAPTDLPPELAPAGAERMSEADRSLVVVMTRVLGPQRLQAYADMLQDTPTTPLDGEFDSLTADADEDVRQGLADRLAPHIRALHRTHPGLAGPDSDAPRGARYVARTVGAAMRDLYNPAQIDVMRRVQEHLAGDPAHLDDADPPGDGTVRAPAATPRGRRP